MRVSIKRAILAFVALAALVMALVACDDSPGSSQSAESDRQQSGYDGLVAGQPAETMDHSPTRETINFWIETWDEPGRLSFVYLQDMTGEYGYYILEGLPVSYCASLTPTFDIIDREGGDVVVPTPAMDGVYYGENAPCNTYYGRDATTGAFMEFTVGQGQNYHLYTEPMPHLPGLGEAVPRGDSTIEDIDSEDLETDQE